MVLPVPYHMRELKDCDIQIKVNDKNLPVVSQTMHMEIMRSRVRSPAKHKESGAEDHL